MESNHESALSMISRIRGLNDSPDIGIINDFTKVTLIESIEIIPVKCYLYFLISNCIQIDYTSTDLPRVIIFDGRCLFKEQEFIYYFGKGELLSTQVQIFRPIDQTSMMMYLCEHLQVNMTLNNNLRLIVIILNSTRLFPDLIDQLNRYLFSLSISTRVVMIVDRLSKHQSEYYLQKPICQVIKCNLENGDISENTLDDEIKLSILKINSATIVCKSIKFVRNSSEIVS